MDNGTICSAFWKHTNLRPGDRIYPCCRFKESIADFKGNVEEVLHISEYRELRRASSAGEKIAGCEKCYYEETIGHRSLRQDFNEKYDVNDVDLEYLEIGLDNLCNLACIGCNSEFSTKWIQKEIDTFGYAMNKYMAVRDINRLPQSVNKILFLGGEPLLTKRFIPMLQSLDNSRDVEIIFNTNATCIPDEETLRLFKTFKTHFIVSVDGVGEVANLVREGTDWQKVLDFITWVKINNFTFEINTVLHKANWQNIQQIAKFVEDQNVEWYVNVLTHPDHLNINRLDNKDKDEFVNLINNLDLPNHQFIINHLFQSMS